MDRVSSTDNQDTTMGDTELDKAAMVLAKEYGLTPQQVTEAVKAFAGRQGNDLPNVPQESSTPTQQKSHDIETICHIVDSVKEYFPKNDVINTTNYNKWKNSILEVYSCEVEMWKPSPEELGYIDRRLVHIIKPSLEPYLKRLCVKGKTFEQLWSEIDKAGEWPSKLHRLEECTRISDILAKPTPKRALVSKLLWHTNQVYRLLEINADCADDFEVYHAYVAMHYFLKVTEANLYRFDGLRTVADMYEIARAQMADDYDGETFDPEALDHENPAQTESNNNNNNNSHSKPINKNKKKKNRNYNNRNHGGFHEITPSGIAVYSHWVKCAKCQYRHDRELKCTEEDVKGAGKVLGTFKGWEQ